MYNDAVDLWDFYGTNLGQVARRLIRRRIRGIWPNVDGMTLMGLGYATPYLRPFRDEAERVFALMPAQQGVLHWPREGRNLVALADESELPLQDVSVDRVLLVHGMECSEQLRPMLQEIWRILAGMVACWWWFQTGVGFGLGLSARPLGMDTPTPHHNFPASFEPICSRRP